MTNNIVSLSGGKDSTAMLLMMLERGEPIHSVVFFDTGWEFPQMHDHIDQVQDYTGLEIIKLKPPKPFNYWLYEHPVKWKGTDKIRAHGYGWPSVFRRWCTRIKVSTILKHCKDIKNPVQCVGYADGEQDRHKDNFSQVKRYPLIEKGITEPEALQYCYNHGFDWGWLYETFHRVSCFCCPLQNIPGVRKVRKHFPKLWEEMLRMDNLTPKEMRPGFKDYRTVHDFDRRFAEEDRQMEMFA